MLRIIIIIIAFASTIAVDAQTEAFHQAVRNLRGNLAKRDSLTLDEMKFEGNVLLSTLHDGHTNMGATFN